ncbi:hypothetical protein [Methylomonas sp. MgM2]
MKPCRRLLLLIAISLCMTACFRTELAAPEGKDVRILSQDEPVNFTTEYKNFYLFGGLLPVWTTQPEEIIVEQDLAEVRVRTQDTISDAVITVFSSLIPIMVFPQHVVVEGNRRTQVETPKE